MIFYSHISLPEGTCGFLLESTFQAPSRRASPCSSKRGRDSTTFAGTSAKLGDHSKEKTLFFAGLWAYVYTIYIYKVRIEWPTVCQGCPTLVVLFRNLSGTGAATSQGHSSWPLRCCEHCTCSDDPVQVVITCSLESQLHNTPGWTGCHLIGPFLVAY